MTTTGFASTDYATWLPVIPAAAMILVLLMFVGASAGSTSGSIKVGRHLVVGRVLRRELDQTMHPEYVARFGSIACPIDERAARAVITFVLIYVGLFVVASIALLADAHRTGLEPHAVRGARRLGERPREHRPRVWLRQDRWARSRPSATSRSRS